MAPARELMLGTRSCWAGKRSRQLAWLGLRPEDLRITQPAARMTPASAFKAVRRKR